MTEGIDEGTYREMVAAQDDAQVDTWAADLFIDFAKRLGVAASTLYRHLPRARTAALDA